MSAPYAKKSRVLTEEGMPLRDQLEEMIGRGILELDVKIENDTSLIRSGLIDSLGLFNLALWIEKEIGSTLQITSLDPSNEWDTMADILKFIENRSIRIWITKS